MCKVIAIANQKGGVGKTTTCVNLGIGLAREGKRVLLIEADAQGSMAASLGIQEPDELEVTLVTIMEKVINDEDVESNEGIIWHDEGIAFIPANIELAGLETALVNVMSREMILKQYLDTVKAEYDYCKYGNCLQCRCDSICIYRRRNTDRTGNGSAYSDTGADTSTTGGTDGRRNPVFCSGEWADSGR